MSTDQLIDESSPEKLQEAVDAFNRRFPVGSEVLLKKDFAPAPVHTRTRSAAFVLSGHSPVVFLEGISGSYHISCVSEAV
jgi:hypothetical protein